ncbi:hypothetical protein MBCUT_06570 [Methanobrevibacter cuticularis]|uniref:Uncharacterized protein n=1 Tax=Methanobrevibacter cuticularis TaxID=47311 RepID=A0A166EG91_9EURY|nr:hypothetical protein [Methanobrevibacter cuticularis]KZX16619.1 hypothetical protein MBCUT_06570 [Methanobrevibacter cuticularis]
MNFSTKTPLYSKNKFDTRRHRTYNQYWSFKKVFCYTLMGIMSHEAVKTLREGFKLLDEMTEEERFKLLEDTCNSILGE